MPTAFIAGATGYTGRSVVTECVSAGLTTVAHVRPDSSRRDHWTSQFEGQGATVDTSPWTAEGITAAFAAHSPDIVFALLGTTKAREGKDGASTYQAVDFALTMLLIDAACAMDPKPTFVYLSAMGADGRPINEYMRIRVKLEAIIAERGLDHVLARPGFITGTDRGEDRPGERIGAVVSDGLLGVLSALGAKKAADKYRSITGPQLGKALVTLALDPSSRGAIDSAAIQAAGR
jgi:nucleoside-diphosphate-sugar epimerase